MTVATAAAMVGVLAPAVGADSRPGGPGSCPGSSCPRSGNEPGNDSDIDVHGGEDSLVRQAAAEAKGKAGILGRFDVNKREGASRISGAGIAGGATRALGDVHGTPRGSATSMPALSDPGFRERLLGNVPDAAGRTPTGPARSQGSAPTGRPPSAATLDAGDSDTPSRTAGSPPDTSGDQSDDAYSSPGEEPSCTPTPTPPHPTPTPPHPTPTPTPPHPTPTPPHPTPTPTPTPPHPTPTPPHPTPTPPHPTPTPPHPTPTPPHPTPTPTPPHPTPTPTPPHPTPTPPHPTPTPPHPTPTPTPPHPTPTPPHPTPTPTPPHPTPSPSHPGELPGTGARGGEWILGSLAAALAAAGGTVLVATRRARRRGN